MSNYDLIPPKVNYGVKKYPTVYDSRHHIAVNGILYDFSNIGTMSLFIKNFVNSLPEYIEGEVQHRVLEKEVNRIDLISWKYYKTPELFWLIMSVNNIINPFDIEEGTMLRILPKHYVEYSLLRYYNDVV